MSIYVRKAPKSLWFSYMALAIFIFTIGYYFEITARSETSAIVATKLQYIGTCYIGPLLVLFIFEYCGNPIRKRYIVAMLIIPTVTLALVHLWPKYTFYYIETIYVEDVTVPYLEVKGSAFYYIFHLYTYLLALISSVRTLLFYKRSPASVRNQSFTLILGIMITVLGSVINVLKLSAWGLNLTPIFLSMTCILLGYSISRQGLYRIVPIAREQIVETMSDGFILADMQGGFIDANSAAIHLFPQLSHTTVGTRIDELESLEWLGDTHMQSEFSILNPVSNEARHHRVSKTVIHFNQQAICICFMIFDITDTKQLLNEVSDLAERDSLTGLVHRGAFYNKGWHLLQNAGGACLLMMDLDFFKDVNDRYGHLKGDEILKETVATLSKCLRSTDLLARYGGEEFCALLPSMGLEDAFELAERIRKRMEANTFESPNGTFNVTLSIGVAMYDSSRHSSLEEFVSDADAALYSAKHKGRNAVALADLAYQIPKE